MEIALKSLEKCTIASTSECVDLLRQVLSGLAFLHDKNVMHRDIKPANILLTHETPGAEWKLGDFGLSKADRHYGNYGNVLRVVTVPGARGRRVGGQRVHQRRGRVVCRCSRSTVQLRVWRARPEEDE